MTRTIRVLSVAGVLALLLSLAVIERRRAGASATAPRVLAAAGTGLPAGVRKMHDFPRHPLPRVQVFEDAKPDPDAPPHPFAAYLAVRKEALKSLEATSIQLDYVDSPLAAIVAAVVDATGIPVHIECPAKEAEKLISFGVRDLKARWVLSLLAQQYDCRLTVSETGEIWIVSNEEGVPTHEPAFMPALNALFYMSKTLADERRPPEHPEAEQALQSALQNTHVSLGFSQMPLLDAIAWLNTNTGVNLTIDKVHLESEAATAVVTADVMNATLREALQACFGEGPVGWHTKDGVIVLTSRDQIEYIEYDTERRAEIRKLLREAEAELLARTVEFGAENLAIRDVAVLLEKALGVPVQIDPETWSRGARFSFEPGPRPASEIVALMKKGAPLISTFRDGTLWFLSPEEFKRP